MSKTKSFSQKFWEDKHGRVVVWQKPNIWLITWFVTLVLSWFSPSGWPLRVMSTVSLLALIIWAVLEMFTGVNYFRRTVGLLVLLIILASHLLPAL